jgi:hypothetical protein
MQAVDVVNRLKEVVGKYNEDFVDLISVSSLTRSGTTATLVTTTNHNLISGDYITVRDAVNPITITSLTRVDDIVTVVTATPTNLVDPSKYDINLRNSLTVTISGADPSEYNGTFQLLTVADDRLTFTYKITTTPATPATTEGFFLQPDFDGYNGYKQVTVVNPTTFTYTVPDNLQSPAQGTIQVVSASRIAWGATIDRVKEFHEADINRVQQNWMYVVLGSEVVYKDGTAASNIDSAVLQNQDYFFEPYQDISVYIYLPNGDTDILGGFVSDKARSLRNLVIKAIANFSFNSDLVEEQYQPTLYVGNEEDDYNKAFYVHRYDFAAKGFVQHQDTIDIDPGVPLDNIDGSFKDKDLTFKPEYI